MSKPINSIKLSFRRTDQTSENNSQEMAACLFSRKWRSKGHEQELREKLLQSPRIGIENYPSRKAFATHLSDNHLSTFSDLTNGLSRKYATLCHARFEEKGRDIDNCSTGEVSVEVWSTEDNPRENNCRKLITVKGLNPGESMLWFEWSTGFVV